MVWRDRDALLLQCRRNFDVHGLGMDVQVVTHGLGFGDLRFIPPSRWRASRRLYRCCGGSMAVLWLSVEFMSTLRAGFRSCAAYQGFATWAALLARFHFLRHFRISVSGLRENAELLPPESPKQSTFRARLHAARVQGLVHDVCGKIFSQCTWHGLPARRCRGAREIRHGQDARATMPAVCQKILPRTARCLAVCGDRA